MNPHLECCQISGQNNNQVQQQLLHLKVLITEGQLEVSDQWVMAPHCTRETQSAYTDIYKYLAIYDSIVLQNLHSGRVAKRMSCLANPLSYKTREW